MRARDASPFIAAAITGFTSKGGAVDAAALTDAAIKIGLLAASKLEALEAAERELADASTPKKGPRG